MSISTKKPIDRLYPQEEDMSLGAALKRRRLNLGWSQEKAALFINVIPPNYYRFEKNIHIPHINKMKNINNFLGYNFWNDGSKSLANRILLYRIEHGITTTVLGSRIGISRNTIQRLESEIKVSKRMTAKVAFFINED